MIAILTDSHSLAQIIARVVGAQRKHADLYESDEYCITWVAGRIVDLAPPAAYGRARLTPDLIPLIPEPFKLGIRQEMTARGMTTDPTAVRQLHIVDDMFARCRSIIAATEAGAEGEITFRWLYAYLGYTKPVQRLWLSALTDEAVREGMTHLRDSRDGDALYAYADTRAKADWIMRVNASHALANAAGMGRNALGRLMTPTLAVIYARYRENKAFTHAARWQLAMTLREGEALRRFRYAGRIGSRKTADSLYSRCTRCGQVRITSVEHRTAYQAPPRLYDLTSLQKVCGERFGISAARTLAAAQSLYRKQLITYPQTESRYITQEVMATVPQLLERLFRQEPFASMRVHIDPKRLSHRSVDQAKVAGHHALLPTGQQPAGDLTQVEQKVYESIIMRTIEAFAPRCRKEVSLVEATVDGLQFRSRSVHVLQPGWRAVCSHEDDTEQDETDDPDVGFSPEETMPFGGISLGTGHTMPEPLYSEATLLTAMQTAGIAAAAERARIIEALFERGYIERSGKTIIPSERGLQLYDMVRDLLIADREQAQRWEQALAQIGRRERSAEGVWQDFVVFTRQVTDQIAALRSMPWPKM
ncbi:DNA topoisomerase [uncultured Alistipes sp.]|uniref:DNA topoisomerase n=1 Tax=uncultured Alistipes sp. TaxID=538949 RepID=UPI00260A81D1|nr:DNA topoisomerase [uncultured Alistipes sp.]